MQLPPNTPPQYINDDGTLKVQELVDRVVALEKKRVPRPKKEPPVLFPMTMDYDYDAETIEPYVTKRGFSIEQIDAVILDVKTYWTVGKGASRKDRNKSEAGWKTVLHNRIEQLIGWGRL